MWGRHSRSAPPTGRQGNVVPPPISFRYLGLLSRETVSLSPLGYLATVPGLVTGPKLLNLPNDAALSFFLKPVTLCGTELLPLLSRETILWHRQCTTVPATVHSAPQRWHMAQHTTVEAQVIDILERTQACDLEEVTRQCTDLTWNQVFLAVDRLSRSGEIILMPRSRGMYTLTFPHRQDGRPDRRSLPS